MPALPRLRPEAAAFGRVRGAGHERPHVSPAYAVLTGHWAPLCLLGVSPTFRSVLSL